jgi:UDPglucose 6-dehydrogenase
MLEAGVGELVREGLATGRLRFVVGSAAAVAGAEVVFLCLPTPALDDGTVDTTTVEAVLGDVRSNLEPHTILAVRSTVPIGWTRRMEQQLFKSCAALVCNPEFLREGSAVYDSLHPERVVVGGSDHTAVLKVAKLIAGLSCCPLVITDPESAEIIKLASNAFLATKLSFVNLVADLCDSLGGDVGDVLLGMGHDPRIGSEYLSPGPGWGGSCLPKDVRALVSAGEQTAVNVELIKAAIAANADHVSAIVDRVRLAVGGKLRDARIAVWGLTFKAGTDDRRGSPAMEIVSRLISEGSRVQAYDPTVSHELPELGQHARIAASAYAACDGAQAVLLLTEWDEFRAIDFSKIQDLLTAPTILDTRNLLDRVALRNLGFTYFGIGRR